MNWSLKICKITCTLTIQKSAMNFTEFIIFRRWADCARLRGHIILCRVLFQIQFIIEKQIVLDVLTIFQEIMTSQFRSALNVAKSWTLLNSGHWTFLIVRVLLNWQMFQLLFRIEKPRLDVLTLSKTFYDLSVSRNLSSKPEMRQFNPSGTERLTPWFNWD